jgi:protoporphyrinogen IX oxidase
MGELFLWVKVVHLLAIISWMAGLFYLPRLFVYHAEARGEGLLGDTFRVMERRLLAAIMRPAGVVSVGSGLWLALDGGWVWPVAVWLLLKVVLVGMLVGFHGLLEVHARRFRLGVESKTGRYFRVINEIPTVLLIGIVGLVVLKPW